MFPLFNGRARIESTEQQQQMANRNWNGEAFYIYVGGDGTTLV